MSQYDELINYISKNAKDADKAEALAEQCMECAAPPIIAGVGNFEYEEISKKSPNVIRKQSVSTQKSI
ncbi:MAG: hypothetical protein O3C05_03255 [Proteobacteria bacterium]|nr:hypothetical protein [Pseudomonadota bacterium]